MATDSETALACGTSMLLLLLLGKASGGEASSDMENRSQGSVGFFPWWFAVGPDLLVIAVRARGAGAARMGVDSVERGLLSSVTKFTIAMDFVCREARFVRSFIRLGTGLGSDAEGIVGAMISANIRPTGC